MADAASLLIKLGFRADTMPLRNVEAKLDGLNSKLRFIVGTEVIRGLFNLTEKFGESAFEIQNAAAAAGITTDALQRLQYAATQSGVETSKLGESMFHLSRVLYQAKMGSEEAMQTFYQLGIDSQQISTFKNAEDALYGVMDALKRIDDPIKQQALIERTMGRGSREMVRFALAGSEAAKQAGRAAGGMGALVSTRQLDALTKARQAMLTLHQVFQAFSATIGAKFAPVLVWAAELVERFYVQNKQLISTTLDDWIENAVYGLGFFIGFVRTAGKAVLEFLGRHKDGAKQALKYAAALKAIGVGLEIIGPALKVIGGAWAGAAFLLEAGPIILATLAIGGLVAVLHDLFTIITHPFGGNPEDLWLYQMTHGVGPIGEAIQWAMDKMATVMDLVSPGSGHPAISGSTVNGLSPDDPGLLDRARRGNALSARLNAPGGLLNQLAQAQMPSSDMSMAAPSTSNYYKQSSAQQQVVNNTVNINATNMTPEQGMKAVTDGVSKSLGAQLDQANRRFDSPFHL